MADGDDRPGDVLGGSGAGERQRTHAEDRRRGKPFVALMLANNETGVIQPIARAAELVRAAGGWLHVDAVQAAGKMAIDSRALGADTLSVSAHKIGGPVGVGALFVGRAVTLTPVQHGGGQERDIRSGTLDGAGIAAFAAAVDAGTAEPLEQVPDVAGLADLVPVARVLAALRSSARREDWVELA